VVQGVIAQTRVIGGLVAMTTFNVIFKRCLISGLHKELDRARIVQIQAGFKAMNSLTTLQKYTVRQAFTSAFTTTAACCAVTALIGFGVGAFVARQKGPSIQEKAREVERLLINSCKAQSATSQAL
jgi:hypothetical protein